MRCSPALLSRQLKDERIGNCGRGIASDVRQRQQNGGRTNVQQRKFVESVAILRQEQLAFRKFPRVLRKFQLTAYPKSPQGLSPVEVPPRVVSSTTIAVQVMCGGWAPDTSRPTPTRPPCPASSPPPDPAHTAWSFLYESSPY